MTVIAFSGERGSGKSEAARICVEEFGYVEMKFADPLKNMLRELYHQFGLLEDQIEERMEGNLKEDPCEFLTEELRSLTNDDRAVIFRKMLYAMYLTIGIAEHHAMNKCFGPGLYEPCPHLGMRLPLDAALEIYFSWHVPLTTYDTVSPRLAMQLLGTEWRNVISETLWSDQFKTRVWGRQQGVKIVCSDYRFVHEGVALTALGATTAYVKRPTRIGLGDIYSQHSSETAYNDLNVDVVLDNTGTLEEFQDKVREFIRDVEARLQDE